MALYDKDWADAIDLKWRTSLRSVSLVTEVEFSDEELAHAIKFFALQLAKNEPDLIAMHHPGIFLVAMTQLGSRSWEEKTFYSKVTEALEDTNGFIYDARRKVEEATKHFSTLLKRFDLAQISADSTSYRWVSPVLLHGAVPLDHLDELLDLIKRHIRKDPSMTGESLVEFLRTRPSHLDREPMALRLFLLHGREFTADYVSRIIDYASGISASLPAHITQRLDEYIQDDSERSLTEFPRAERPSFALTPDGSLVLRLPPAIPSDGSRVVEWTIRYNKSSTYIRSEVPYLPDATKTNEETFFLPAPGLEASVIRGGFQADISLIDPRDPLLIFDAMGSLLSRAEPVPPGDVTIFWPSSKNVDPLINGMEIDGTRIQPPFGWGGWNATQLRVEQGSTIQFADGPVHSVQPRDRKAQLVLPKAITDTYSVDGMPVFGALPRISLPSMAQLSDWEILVRDSSGAILVETTPTEFDFEIPIDATEIADKLTISARGPLGRGFVKTIPIVTGLSTTIFPAHRRLVSEGGVQACTVQLTRNGQALEHYSLGEHEFTAQFQIGALRLKVVPTSEAYRIVEEGQDLPWSSRREMITAKRMRSSLLQVRGLNCERAVLSYSDGNGTPESIERVVRRGVVEFSLRDFADAAGRTNNGFLVLQAGSQRINVASVRPERLVEFGELDDLTLNFQRYSDSALTMVLFRTLQPWIPAQVVRVPPGCESIELPSRIRGNGPIRVFAELEDEWGAGPNLKYRERDDNSKNYYLNWDMTLVHGPDREICKVLSGLISSLGAPTRQTIMRAVQVIHHYAAFNELPQSTRQALLLLVREHAAETLDEIAQLECSEIEKAQLLVRTGLHAIDHHQVDSQGLDHIAHDSPVVAFLAKKLNPNSENEADLRTFFIDQFGQELEEYWNTPQINASDGRWDPYLRTMSIDTIKTQLAVLGAVPGLPLEGDTRIIASSAVLLTQRGQEVYSKKWISVVSKSRSILERTSLWDLVTSQAGHEELCLPAASIALSLIARLAAHRDVAASAAYPRFKDEHAHLATIAPELTYIDIIRAEAAVSGVLAK